MKKHKLLALFSVLFLLLGLAACSSSGGSEEAASGRGSAASGRGSDG